MSSDPSGDHPSLKAEADTTIAAIVSQLPDRETVIPLRQLEDYLEDYRERREDHGDDHAAAVACAVLSATFDVLMRHYIRGGESGRLSELRLADIYQRAGFELTDDQRAQCAALDAEVRAQWEQPT
jgi:hypothetical protein